MSQDTLVYTDTLTTNGAATVNGTATLSKATVTSTLLASDKKFGTAAAGDILDFSAAQGKILLGPTSTTLKFGIAATTSNMIDTNANQICSCSKQTGSTNAATAHNYAVATPTIVIGAITGTATAWSFGTVTATQDTPAMTSAGAYVAYVALI